MKFPLLLFVCWCSSIFEATSSFRVDGYSCVTSYQDTITCVLNITGNPAEPSNTTYSLKFSGNERVKYKNTTCPLVLRNHTYRCDCKVLERNTFHSSYRFVIQVCNESACHPSKWSFEPLENIQLTSPYDIEVQKTPETFNITWKSGYETHRYFSKWLDYELLLQKSHSSWSQTLIPETKQQFVSIPRSDLDTYATYCMKVRSTLKVYKAPWSEWSPTTCLKDDAEAAFSEQGNLLVILTKSLGPVCAVAGVLLFVYYSPTARMKIKTLSHTPSPAPFFQPLFQLHQGNLQEWLSPQGKCAQTYKTEEVLLTNAVTIVPKPITKDLEENQEIFNPLSTQLVFGQCQSSYVGLPEMHEASQPITMVCPGGTSYTQLPCSVWSFGPGDVQVVPSPPQTFLEISHTDSGCSCEDMTQSPECSLPNSPVDDSSPPCFCNDYCILNKTAEGVVPVLVSK
ncbi:interleukin-21 receptor-like [Trachinotus anak]|uniref:interleukin-21 receptor-like n=1 Tax=Trachinotus anak TaxID=443729 RepID=UPI0039F22759